MDNPGIFDLGDFTITAAADTLDSLPITDSLEGMTALSLQFMFAYGSGGGVKGLKAYLRTSLDQGQTWIDIACVTFGTASKTTLLNLSGLTPVTSETAPTDGTLADDTVLDGILGDRLQLRLISTAAYAGPSVLSVRAAAR